MMPRFVAALSAEKEAELRNTAYSIVTSGKGILAADDNHESMGRNFAKYGVENTEETRRQYHQALFQTAERMSAFVSGVILRHETLYQKTDDGTPIPKLLQDNGIIPGINVDKFAVPLGGTDGETTTQGLDDLAARCKQYAKDGAKFAKWLCLYKVGTHQPSHQALIESANVMARYASICQQNGLVPIVEPMVQGEGDHDLETAQRITQQVLSFQYKALLDHNVFLEGTLLKPNMVTAGFSCTTKYTPEQVAKATVLTLRRSVPVAVPGILFLSGGQSDEDSTVRLNAINQVSGRKPWPLTFCFGRALQNPFQKVWQGESDNIKKAQDAFVDRAKANSDAALGKYKPN